MEKQINKLKQTYKNIPSLGVYDLKNIRYEVVGIYQDDYSDEPVICFEHCADKSIKKSCSLGGWINKQPKLVATREFIDATKKTLREIKSLHEKANQEHKQKLEELQKQLNQLQLTCPHAHTKYHPDASGNNDSWTECLDCGAEL